jgi:hypothetical protein
MNAVQIWYLEPLMNSQRDALRRRGQRHAQLRAAAAARASIGERHLLRARVAKSEEGADRLWLEPLEVPTLARVLSQRGALGPKAAVAVVAGVARAVTALEHAGLTARDLTPDQVLLDRERGAVLAEYGIPPHLLPLSRPQPDPSLAYRAPEEREGGDLTPRASVYSLGAILLAALTGEAPPERVRAKPDRGGRDLPPTLESVVARATSVDPEARYEDALEMAQAAVEAVRATERLARVKQAAPKPAKPSRVVSWTRPRVVKPEPTAPEETAGESAKRDKRARIATERAEKERAVSERAERERAERDRAEAERAELERAAAERAELERAAADRAERHRVAAERAERDRVAAERAAVERAERERAAADRADRERAAAEQAARERAAAKRAERERVAAERAERKAAKRGRRQREAAQAAERRSAQAAQRKRARAAARRPKRDAAGGHTAKPAHAPKPAPPQRRGAHHEKAATRPDQKRPAPQKRLARAAFAAAASPRRPRATAVAAFGVGAAVLGAVLLASGGGNTDASPTQITNGALTVQLPAGWERTAKPTARVGRLSDTLAATRTSGSRLLIGTMSEPSDSARAIQRLAPAEATPVRARLGRLEVARYGNLSPRPGRTGAAYLLNTTGPSVLILCEATKAAALRTCEKAAATLRLNHDSPISLAAAHARQESADQALSAFSAKRLAARSRLASATIAAGQAKAAGDLQASYYETSQEIDAAALPGAKAAGLVTALAAAGDAYGRLADAVTAHDEDGFDVARAEVLEREANVWKELPSNLLGALADQP